MEPTTRGLEERVGRLERANRVPRSHDTAAELLDRFSASGG